MHFELLQSSGNARYGKLQLAHGKVETPVFMPIATTGAVKTLSALDVKALGAEIILGNTYHLHLRPGDPLIADAGGLHKYMNWPYPILTDSGGFQVLSLAKIRKVSEEGVTFQSHLDGRKLTMTPEDSMMIQKNIGSDIAMVLDECLPYPSPYDEVQESIQRTTRWAKRCKEFHEKHVDPERQSLFAIVQGGTYPELRKQSAQELIDLEFPGYAIGGLAVGEPHDKMYETLDATLPLLPKEKPRYLMGVGTPENILEAVSRGIDMFDCVLPTRNARHASIFTSQGMLSIKAARYAKDFAPLDAQCKCSTCQNFSRSYLRHLFSIGEPLAARLATIHNLHFYLELMRNIRESLQKQQFDQFKKTFLDAYLQKK